MFPASWNLANKIYCVWEKLINTRDSEVLMISLGVCMCAFVGKVLCKVKQSKVNFIYSRCSSTNTISYMELLSDSIVKHVTCN